MPLEIVSGAPWQATGWQILGGRNEPITLEGRFECRTEQIRAQPFGQNSAEQNGSDHFLRYLRHGLTMRLPLFRG
jgi:hypothetical protein